MAVEAGHDLVDRRCIAAEVSVAGTATTFAPGTMRLRARLELLYPVGGRVRAFILEKHADLGDAPLAM